MEFLDWLEHSSVPMWMKEQNAPISLLGGYDLYLVSHAVGMAFLVGLSAAVALRILGFAPRLPLAPMEKFFPLMYAGFWVNAVSGVVLFITYPIEAVTNPGFYIKMGGVVSAVVCIRRIRRQVFGNPANLDTRPLPMNSKILAGTLLFIWLATITAGRLMAYHGSGVGVEWTVPLALLIVTVVMLLAWFIAARLLRGNKQLRQGA